MPAYKVQIGEESYRLDFPNDPTPDEMQAAVANLTAPAAAAPPETPATVTASGTQEEGHPYLATAARIALPIAGGVAGALSPVPGGAYVGSGLGGAAGETLAEYLTGQSLDPKEIALQGGVAAIPFVGKARTPLAGAVLRGAEGATLGGVSEAARDWLHDRSIDLTGVLKGSAFGGLFGLGGGALEGTLARRATLANLPLHEPPPPEAPRTVPGVFGEVPAAEAPPNRVVLPEVFHGTGPTVADVRALNPEVPDSATGNPTAVWGTFFTPDAREAERYVQDFHGGKGQVLKASVTLNDPYPMSFHEYDQFTNLDISKPNLEEQMQALTEKAREFKRQRQLEGYDGIIIGTPGKMRPQEVVAFRSDQIAAPRGLDFPPPFPVEHPPASTPTLGQMALPGVPGLGEGALSAHATHDLAPSIIDHVETADDVKWLVNDLAARNTAMIGDARRGVQTTAEREAAAQPIVAELAHRLGTSPDTFAQSLRQRGEAVNAEQMDALKTVFTSVTGDFYDVAKQVAAGDADPQTLLKMAKAMNLAKGVLAQKTGAVAEAGRALNALRGTQRMERLHGKVLEALLSKAGTSEDALQDIAAKAATVAELNDPVALTRFLREATEATTADKIYEAWVNGLLSGPRTHVVNNVSNAIALGLRLPEEALSGSLDALRASVTGGPRQRFAGEAVADGLGITRGLIGGARAALRAFQTEAPQFGAQRIEGNPFAIKGALGRVVRIPSRLLLAADEFWKTAGIEGAAHAQAYREAAKDGYAGTARLARMSDLLTTDRERLIDAAKPETLYRTFQGESDIAKAVGGLRNIRGVRYVLPFVRTPINVASFGLERTPFGLAPLMERAWKGTLKPGELTDGAARVALGTGLAGAVVALAEQGRVTGAGPSDPAEQNALRGTGWQPYSTKVGDQFFSYSRLEPVGAVLGMAADAAEAMRNPLVSPEEVAGQLGATFARRLTDQTFLSGLRAVLDAVDDPGRFGSAYVKRLAASAIPTGIAQLTGALDPVQRDTSTFENLLKSRIPGLSKDVPPVRNVWGEEVPQKYQGMAGLLSPSATTTLQDDPASVEVRRLVETAGLGLSSPARSFKTKGEASQLTPQEYDRFTQQAGELAKRLVTKVVTAPTYQRITSDEKRARIVQNVIGKARDVARMQLKVQRLRAQGGVPLPIGP